MARLAKRSLAWPRLFASGLAFGLAFGLALPFLGLALACAAVVLFWFLWRTLCCRPFCGALRDRGVLPATEIAR